MRIDAYSHIAPNREPAVAKNSRPYREFSPEASPHGWQGDDVVQLTLNTDGIWEVNAASLAPTDAFATTIRDAPQGLPRLSRLYHALGSGYSPDGFIRPTYSRGLLVDTYV